MEDYRSDRDTPEARDERSRKPSNLGPENNEQRERTSDRARGTPSDAPSTSTDAESSQRLNATPTVTPLPRRHIEMSPRIMRQLRPSCGVRRPSSTFNVQCQRYTDPDTFGQLPVT